MNMNLKKIGRKQRALLVLPLLVLPFVTLAFWALGGGKGSRSEGKNETQGFNMQLPQAQLPDDQNKTKLSFYEMQKAVIEPDTAAAPVFDATDSPVVGDWTFGSAPPSTGLHTLPHPIPKGNPPEAEVYQKLAELNKVLVTSSPPPEKPHGMLHGDAAINGGPEVSRLRQMMQEMERPQGKDPELEQLNGLMEKILSVQEGGQKKVDTPSAIRGHLVEPLVVSRYQGGVTVSCLGVEDTVRLTNKTRFHTLTIRSTQIAQNTIEAEVYQTQTLKDGAMLTLRTLTDLAVNKCLVPAGSFVSGACRLSGERLQVTILSIRTGRSLYPVHLEAFDMDGNRGLYVPGAITREVMGETADKTIQRLSVATLDPSLRAQATEAGLQAVRTLFSKKVKQVNVTVRGGHKVLLKPTAF